MDPHVLESLLEGKGLRILEHSSTYLTLFYSIHVQKEGSKPLSSKRRTTNETVFSLSHKPLNPKP